MVLAFRKSSRSHRFQSTSVPVLRSEEHTSELQSRSDLVCRLLLEKKKKAAINSTGTGKRGDPTKTNVPETQTSTARRAREPSVALHTFIRVRKSKSSEVKSETTQA